MHIAGVNDHAVAEAQGLAGADGEAGVAPGVAFEIVQAENFAGQKSVSARVPVRRGSRVRGMIENRDASGAAEDLPRLTHPPGALPHTFFSPCLFCALTILPVRLGSAISLGCSSSSGEARRMANMPSLVSPNFTSTCGESVMSKSIMRTCGSE